MENRPAGNQAQGGPTDHLLPADGHQPADFQGTAVPIDPRLGLGLKGSVAGIDPLLVDFLNRGPVTWLKQANFD